MNSAADGEAQPTERPGKSGTWVPAPSGMYGIAIAQFRPPQPASDQPTDQSVNVLAQVVALDVGDLVQLIEHAPKAGWYRGYVYPAALPSMAPALGIFPDSFIYIKQMRIPPSASNGGGADLAAAGSPTEVSPITPESGDNSQQSQDQQKQQQQRNQGGFRPLQDRIRVQDKSIDFSSPESPNTSIENLSPAAAREFGDPDYVSPADQWLTTRLAIDKINVLPAPEYPAFETELGQTEPIVDEASHVLRDWCNNMRTSLQSQNYIQYAYVKKHILGLFKGRRLLLQGKLTTPDALARQRKDLVNRIAAGNAIQSSEVIVRNESTGTVMTDGMATIKQIKDLHTQLEAQIRSEGGKGATIHVSSATPMVDADITSHHVFLEMKGALPEIPAAGKDPLEFRFAVYSKSDSKYLTDEFVMVRDPKLGVTPGLKTLFVDFSSADVAKDNVLVLRVVRLGQLKDSDPAIYRLPIAGGALDIRDILAGKETQPTSGYVIKLYAPKDETGFPTLSMDLVNRTGMYEPIKADCVYVNVRALTDAAAPAAKGAPRTLRMGFGEPMDPTTFARNSVYVTLDSAEFSKQLGKTFEVNLSVRANTTGETIKGAVYMGADRFAMDSFDSLVFHHALSPKWNETVRVDVPFELMDKTHLYLAIRPCSSSGSAERTSRTVAFAFKPLLRTNGAALPDGSHTLNLFKFDKKVGNDPAVYLAAGPNGDGSLTEGLVMLKESITISSYVVSTTHSQHVGLVKVLNWRRALNSAFNDLPSVLKDMKLINEMELIKFTVPVVDSLFGIMCSSKNESGELSRLIFDNLLHIFAHVYHERDRRYIHFRQAVQGYIDTKFAQVGAVSHLANSITSLIEDVRRNAKNTDAIRQLHTTFKSFVHFFRFMMQCGILAQSGVGAASGSSDQLISQTQAQQQQEVFDKTMRSLFECINQLMGDTSDHLSATQQFAFQNFAQVVPLMFKFYPNEMTVSIIIKFTDSLSSKRGSIVQKKLTFILSIIRGPLFKADVQSRRTLTEAIVRWLRMHIGWWEPGAGDLTLRTQIYNECVDILAELLDKLQTLSDQDDQDSATVLKLADLLPNLLEAYRDAVTVPVDSGSQRTSTGQVTSGNNLQIASKLSISTTIQQTQSMFGTQSIISAGGSTGSSGISARVETQTNPDTAKIASTFLSVFNLMSEAKIAEYFLNVHQARGHAGTTKFVHQVFGMIESLLRGEAYPSTWVNLNLIAQRTALRLFRSIALLMQHQFMPPAAPSFDQELWTRFFVNAMTLLNSPYLQKETWTAQRWRTAYKLQIPKLVAQGGQLLKTLWKAIGTLSNKDRLVEYQLRMIPTLLPLVLELTMSQHESLCTAASYILFSMIKREYGFCQSIKRLESLCVDHLDRLILARRKGDDRFRRIFMFTMCRLLVTRNHNPDLRRLVTEYLLNVDRFMILLLGLRSLPPGNEYEDEQWSGIYKLAKFMKAVSRTDIYLKYVHHLAIKQLNSNNFVEAAWTLKLHADLLTWSDRILDPSIELGFESAQKEHERKEELLQQILVYFEEGKAWESAITVCKELLEYYESVVYNYERMAETLSKLAALYQSIIKEQRFYSEYFRVGYYGMGFPATLRNKQFVYRGLEWEKLGTFCERIQNKHPDSVLLKNNAVPGDETLTADGRFLQITAVVPEPDMTQLAFTKGDVVPESIRSYYQFNNVNRFSVSRPFRKGAKTGNEFLDLWTEKTTYTTEDMFPHLLRRSEAMIAKNRDLIALEKKYEKFTEPQNNCSPLTMSINGSVDAPVNGGVFMYKKAFIKSNYRNDNPDKAEWVTRLEEAIDEQVIILDRCIAIHNRIAPAPMRPLHDTIVAFFQKNFAEEIERLGIVAHYEPTASPQSVAPPMTPGGIAGSSLSKAKERTSSSLSNLTLGSSGGSTALGRKGTVKLKDRFITTTASTASAEDLAMSGSNTPGQAIGTPGSGGNSDKNLSRSSTHESITNLNTIANANTGSGSEWKRAAPGSILSKMRASNAAAASDKRSSSSLQ
ncbi:hypothetical protein BCR44DRAFT_1509724 [Catenaria anguillulae PL171]|uniref:Dedicator of cytokinesis-domain-containing protein n=1 Tax=Catenaria anguillulae PL171 TaxID=765915 RepID=A0A1Y2I0W5_9FUNG|nr:hypothetical protein BCR44DRAFT_1509724 [Catenaria anguillulae PL171]